MTVEMPLAIADANGLSGRLSAWLLDKEIKIKPQSEKQKYHKNNNNV